MPDLQSFTAAELLAYQRQLSLSQVAAGAMVSQAPAGIGGSQVIYEGYPNLSSAQQLLYYN